MKIQGFLFYDKISKAYYFDNRRRRGNPLFARPRSLSDGHKIITADSGEQGIEVAEKTTQT